jgi:hypothetical protein
MNKRSAVPILVGSLLLGALSHLVLNSCRNPGSDELDISLSEITRVTFQSDSCLKFDTDIPNWSCSETGRALDWCTVKAGDQIAAIGMFQASADANYWLFGMVSEYTEKVNEQTDETPSSSAGMRCTADLINEKVTNPRRLAWLWKPHLDMSASSTPGVQQAVASRTLTQANVASGIVTSGFGWRWGRPHNGIDIGNSEGTPILAACAGTVSYAAGGYNGGFGSLIEITHEPGTCGADVRMTRYAHNSKLLRSYGARVEAGDKIAEMGSTGESTGPHLHFETHTPGGPQNPFTVLIDHAVRIRGKILEWFWELFGVSQNTALLFIGKVPESDPILMSFSDRIKAAMNQQITFARRDIVSEQLALVSQEKRVSEQAPGRQIEWGLCPSAVPSASADEDSVFCMDLHGGKVLP